MNKHSQKNAKKANKKWLTDFCDSLRVFVSIVMIQIVVLIYSLSFLSFDLEYLRKLSILTLLVQLIGLITVIFLCKFRQYFNKILVFVGLGILVLFLVLITTVLAQLIGYFDMQLTFDMFENQQEVNHLNIKLSFSSVIVCFALLRYFYMQDQWEAEIKNLSDAKLTALQARIKPHFLFNSLNTIASLITIDAEKAETAITNFSKLMRRAFTFKDKNIGLEEELQWIEQYLFIEKLRMGDRLNYSIDCDKKLYPIKIPVLCIQPLVENAIIHGIQTLENGGLIDLQIEEIQKKLVITVENPYITHSTYNSNGTAINNIRQRLQLQYGDKARVVILDDKNTYKIVVEIPI